MEMLLNINAVTQMVTLCNHADYAYVTEIVFGDDIQVWKYNSQLLAPVCWSRNTDSNISASNWKKIL